MTRPPVWWPAFFVAYERTDRNITASAEMVGKTARVVYYHLGKNPEFRSRIDAIDAELAGKFARQVEYRFNSQGS